MSLQNRDFGIKVAQLVGIGVSAYASGFIGSFTIAGVPSLLLPECPAPLASKLWLNMFDTGKKVGPALALVSSSAYIYLASTSLGRTATVAYATAAGLTLGIVPLTLVLLQPTNLKLIAHAGGEGKLKGVEDSDVKALLRKWSALNGVRSALPAIGAVIALATALGLYA